MGWTIFIEEPGRHQAFLPYNVLAGIIVEDRLVWQLASRLKEARTAFFGSQIADSEIRLKLEEVLSEENVSLARSKPDMLPSQRRHLLEEYFSLEMGNRSANHEIAFAQAKAAFHHYVIGLLQDFECKAVAVFNSSESASLSSRNRLRKDYVFLFERIFYFLKDQSDKTIGMLILDPKRHSESPVSTSVMAGYFEKTAEGRLRSQLLIPEPVMANTSLALVNHAAATLSQILSWSFRLSSMTHQRRTDIDDLLRECIKFRFYSFSDDGRKEWSFKFVENLRGQNGPIVSYEEN